MERCLARLLEATLISKVDVHLARRVSRLGKEARPVIVGSLALASAAARRGDGAVHVDRLMLDLLPVLDNESSLGEMPPDGAQLAGMIGRSPLCIGEGAPLVVDRYGFVYLRWRYELLRRLVTAIEQRVPDRAALSVSDGDDLFHGGRLAVVTGGPGTGKTTLVASVIGRLMQKEGALRVVNVAPTGKAAARLQQAIGQVVASGRLQDARIPPEVVARIPTRATTIHRALGLTADGGQRPRYHRDFPLPADVVVVDEASMVDQALMAILFDALSSTAKVILVGDQHQLASVAPGAVLGDICLGSARRGGLAGQITTLTTNYRFDAASGIGALAQAINRGDETGTLDLLRDGVGGTICWVSGETGLARAVRMATDNFEVLRTYNDPGKRLLSLSRFGLLCATRKGPSGVEPMVARVVQALGEPGSARRGFLFDGAPVMVRANDYVQSLFNGDVGVVCGHGRAATVVFPGETAPRPFSPQMLPRVESGLALTVHQSQGSEYDQVVVCLPDAPSRVLSRQLLYTAVTRARKRVMVVGGESAIRSCVANPNIRSTGLARHLWG